MDFSKLLNAIRGNKAADASAAPKDRPDPEEVIPVEVAPTVAAADHPPPTRPTGGIVQSLLGQFSSHREATPPAPSPPAPVNGPANGYDDVLASVIPSPAPPPAAAPPPPNLSASPPLDADWFDVPLGDEPPLATAGPDASVLELPPDAPPLTGVQPAFLDDLPTEPPAPLPVAPFEVSGKVDLSWTPVEIETPGATSLSPEAAALGSAPTTPDAALDSGPAGAALPPPMTPPPVLDPPAAFDQADRGGEALATSPPLPSPLDPPYAAPSVSPYDAPYYGGDYRRDAYASDAYAGETYPPAMADAPLSASESTEVAAAEATATARYADWLVESLDEALILVDAQGAVCHLNPMAEYLLGCPRSDALGRALLDLAQRLGGDNAPLWEHLAVTSEAQQFSAAVTLPDGQSLMASLAVLEVPPRDDWMGGRVIAIRDETRLRAELAQVTEEAAPAPQSSSALDVTPEQLRAMHTSLQMVLGFAELLHRGEYGPMNPQQFEMFRNIEHHAKQLAGWIGLPSE